MLQTDVEPISSRVDAVLSYLRRRISPGSVQAYAFALICFCAATLIELGMLWLVVHHSDFDVLIPSHSRIGKLSGGTRISMLLGTPG